jgi:hypothetical protein
LLAIGQGGAIAQAGKAVYNYDVAKSRKPERKGPPSKRGRRYQKPTLTKHGPLDSDVAAFSALY